MLLTLIKATCDDMCINKFVGPEQVFLTSHNPTSLDAFDLFDENQKVFVVMRDPSAGFTQIMPLVPDSRWSKADWIKAYSGKSLSELWIEGKIKGALGI
jgi:hypothetical protein